MALVLGFIKDGTKQYVSKKSSAKKLKEMGAQSVALYEDHGNGVITLSLCHRHVIMNKVEKINKELQEKSLLY